MLNFFEEYFGLKEDGVDLLRSLRSLPSNRLEVFKERFLSCKGRIFFLGNGGSYDNARWMAQISRQQGFKAKAPGIEEDYILTIDSKGYSEIFLEGLKFDELSKNDLVVGISGSGNSLNVVKAFDYAREVGADVFALGGRDGGLMLESIGGQNCLIVDNECMEAIEDLHNLIFLIVIDSLRQKLKIQDTKELYLSLTKAFLSHSNLHQISNMAVEMIRTIRNGGRTFILGLGIGANHFRADMGRGATNALPIRGLSCPEVFTMNSLQATANDDGTDFLIVDGLVKYNPKSTDFAILCDPGYDSVFLCEELLVTRKVPFIKIGQGGIQTQMFKAEYFDLAVTLIGHSCGYSIRRHLLNEFEVEPLLNDLNFKNSQKKLSDKETVSLELKLLEEGVISESESITFCYGQAFKVKSKNEYQREFY